MEADPFPIKRSLDPRRQILEQSPRERVPKRGMCNDTRRVVEKGGRTDTLGAVYDLVWEDKVPRTDFFAEGADSGKGDDGFDAEGFEGGDVGAGGDGGWGVDVSCTMACDECEMYSRWETGDSDGGARVAPRLAESQSGLVHVS